MMKPPRQSQCLGLRELPSCGTHLLTRRVVHPNYRETEKSMLRILPYVSLHLIVYLYLLLYPL